MPEINEDFYKRIPKHLLDKAYCHKKELAFPRPEALQVVDIASDNSVAILEIEVWLPTESGPAIGTYGWSVEPRRGDESWYEFVQRANRVTKERIQQFEWAYSDWKLQHEMPFFNLLLDDNS